MYASDGKVPDWNQGYGSDAILSHDQILDWNDKLYLYVYPEKAKDMDLWPREPKSFRFICKFFIYVSTCSLINYYVSTINREIADAFTEELMVLIDKVFKALARNLGLVDDYFINNGAKGRISERYTYYPRCSKPDLVFGFKPHSDASSLTFILQEDQVPGLQVFNDELGWTKVPTLPNALLVFIGDEMEVSYTYYEIN